MASCRAALQLADQRMRIAALGKVNKGFIPASDVTN